MRVPTLSRIGWAAMMIAVGSIVPWGVGTANAAPAAPTWHLVGHHQRACFDANVHDAWFGVFIKGTWTHAINVGMKLLPAGATYSTSYTPIAPGSSNGQYTLAYADAKLASNTPIGTYSVSLGIRRFDARPCSRRARRQRRLRLLSGDQGAFGFGRRFRFVCSR
jgi:hypothetical protein